jgi:hypothetical protein
MKVPTADQREARFYADYRRVHFRFSSSEPSAPVRVLTSPYREAMRRDVTALIVEEY